MRYLLTISLIFLGCAPALYLPSETNVPAGSDLIRLREGRRLYVAHCGHCHMLHLPDEYSPEGWAGHLEVMQKKSRISDAERILIYEYLTQAPSTR